MPCEVLGAGTAHAKQLRGRLYKAQDTPAAWGSKQLETPHYFIATISDATAAEVQFLFEVLVFDTGALRWIMTPAEVVNANGKSYTLVEFEAVMVDQT